MQRIDKINEIRAQVVVLWTERKNLAQVGANRKEISDRLPPLVAQASEGATATGQRALQISASRRHTDSPLRMAQYTSSEQYALMPFFVLMLGESAVMKALEKHLAAIPDGPDANDRKARLAEIEAKPDQ